MNLYFDEFSKSLAESLPRRESLRRLGVVLAGGALGPLVAGTAWAGRTKDACQTFCKCRNRKAQEQCLAACRACKADGGTLCGGCGDYYCADLSSDLYHCGACGHECDPPGPWEHMNCINGRCEYWCADVAVNCDGVCTVLDLDGNNCGACGNVCPTATPYCVWGVCLECPGGQTKCDGVCADLATDPLNCGACGHVCTDGTFYCDGGVCYGEGPWVDPGPSP